MPAQRPRASFDPIAPDFDLEALVENTPNFQFVDRISCDMIDQQGLQAFERLVSLHVVQSGKPLVIDGYQSRLDPWTFSSKWLQDNRGDRVEEARDLRKEFLYTPLTIAHYMKNMGKLAEQYFEKRDNYRDMDRQRVYLKDIDCPEVWHDKLKEHLPANVFYLNDTVGELGGPGSVDEVAPAGGKRKGKGIAVAGDLMSCLPPPMRAENMMCYIGHEGTYTPAHREMCASLGHNIMVETSDVLGDDGKPERPGSSIWFMTESKDRHIVSEYWLSILGHNIEVEKHFAQVAAWKKAPFTTYIVEQKAGDFILIPPLAPHQVWNRGTRTMKAAWNRTTIGTLEMALNEALPNARMVCRDEQYKNKAIVFYSLQKYSALLAKARDQEQTAPSPQEAAALRTSPRIRQLRKDFKKLLNLFKEILLSEMFSPETNERNVQFVPFESTVTCAYCRCNIFNRFLSCGACDDLLQSPEPEPYDICMECYAMGRSCGCISRLRWTEQFKWKELTQKYEQWRKQILEIDGSVKPGTPLSLQEERQRLVKKTLAQVCQEQLKRRPWVDVYKGHDAAEEESDDEEIEVNDDGTVKKAKKRRSEAWFKNRHACHVCAHRHEKWKMAECKCGKWWCYGSLFRAHELMPQEIMENPEWQCPHCRGVCNAGSCRKDPRQTPYKPKVTLLGHDTRKVADARSVESLVDFSVSNLTWLQETTKAPTDNARLRQRQEEAEQNKVDDPMDDNEASDIEGAGEGIEYSPGLDKVDPLGTDNSLIDPSLRETGSSGFTAANKPKASMIPAVSALLNAEQGTSVPTGYAPATQSGYIVPQAVMYQSSYGQTDGVEESLIGNMDTLAVLTGDSMGKKRARVSDGDQSIQASVKMRRTDESGADGKLISGATKQYRKEKERQALEEARKTGRFILTHAKLRGRSKVIKLKIGRAHMAKFSASDKQAKDLGNNDLLRSDVQPAEPAKPRQELPVPQPARSTKAVRIRVEKDDDFRARNRGSKSAGVTASSSNKKIKSQHFEEVELGTDSEKGIEAPPQLDGAFETTDTGGKKRRTSAWQSKLPEDDPEELPDALPDNWKDRGKNRTRRSIAITSSPASVSKPRTARKSVAQIKPDGKPRGRPFKAHVSVAQVDNLEERSAVFESMPSVDIQADAGSAEIPKDEGQEDQVDSDEAASPVKPVASLFNRAVKAMTSGSLLSKQLS